MQEPEARRHTTRLLNLAAGVGIGEDEASQYTPHELLQIIQAETANRKPAAAAPPPPVEKDPEVDWGTDEEGNPVKPEQLHPVLRKAKLELHEMKLAYGKQSREFKEALAKFEEREKAQAAREEARQQQALFDRMDRLFTSQPDIFGTMARDDLKVGSAFAKRRERIAKLMPTFQGSLKQQFEEACELVFGDLEEDTPEPRKPARRQAVEPAETAGIPVHEDVALERDRKRWAKSNGTAVPSARTGPVKEETREQKALNGIRKLKRERGLAVQSGYDEEELLPD